MLDNTVPMAKFEMVDEMSEILTLVKHSLCISDIMQNDYFLPSSPNPHLLAYHYEQNQILINIIFNNLLKAKNEFKSLIDKVEAQNEPNTPVTERKEVTP